MSDFKAKMHQNPISAGALPRPCWGRASTGSKASGLGDKAAWSCRKIFLKRIRHSNISKDMRDSLWSFSAMYELRIYSRRHVDRHQVLSTIDRRPSPVDHTQRPALCTARWWLGVTQCVARSVGVNQDLLLAQRLEATKLMLVWHTKLCWCIQGSPCWGSHSTDAVESQLLWYRLSQHGLFDAKTW